VDEVAFGRYRLLSLIGEGGMSKVYRANDTVIGRDIAIKVLPPAIAAEPGYEERFRREAQAAARLSEPHIIPVYDTGEIDGQLYLVMPIVAGTDLHSLLRRHGPMSPQRAVHVIEQLAAALNVAHQHGLVHRDVKPSNALVTDDDFVYLIDFGIAHDAGATKLTRTGAVVGTMAYMAPERFTAGTADARSDVYALACVLYECLTGAQPYPGDTVERQIAGHLTLPPPKPTDLNPAVPPGFDAVIAAGMAKKPEERYQSARELATAARTALASAPAPAPIPQPAPTVAAQPAPTTPVTPWPAYGAQPHYPAVPPQPYGQPPPYVPGPPGPGAPYPPQFQPPPQRAPRSSPFAGVPRGDFTLDAAAVVALLAILLLPWTATQMGYSRPEVIVGCLLGLCAVALPYLSRTGMFGSGWTPKKLRVAKLVTAVPLGLCAATYFVIDAILGAINGGLTQYAPAAGAWIAAAASVLAALPRRSDLIDGGSPGNTRLWGNVLTVTCVALPACAALALLSVMFGTYRSLPAVLELRALIALPITEAVILGIWVIAVWKVARQAARGDAAGRLVLAAAGAGALVWAIFAAVGQFTLGTAESLHLPFGGFTLTMVAALVASSPSLRQPGEWSEAQTWLSAARGVLGLAVVADILLLAQVIAAVTLTGVLTVAVFTAVICAGVGAIAADWARGQVILNALRCRVPVLVASTVQAVTGIVAILVMGLSPNPWEVVTGPEVIAALALPAAAAGFVTLPKPIRTFFPTAAPIPPSGPPLAPDPAALAADPGTPPHVLHNLAQQHIALWPRIAGNPAAPHDLLAWLAQSPDPEVHAALRARQR